jgi:N-acetylmuramoyl-L-alanine amidase
MLLRGITSFFSQKRTVIIMKKYQILIYFFMPFLLLLLWTGSGPAEAAGTISIIVDGSAVYTDVPPYIDANNRTIVPIRFISEELGCEVDWNQGEKKATISRQDTTVEIYIDKHTALVNGKEVTLDTTAVLKEGRTMVPVRFLAETFKFKVTWREEERTVVIESQGSQPPSGKPETRDPEVEEPKTEKPETGEHETEERFAVVNGNNVNIRSGPGTNYERLTQFNKGVTLKVLDQKDSWLQVELPSGGRGWIAGWLVDFPGTPTGTIPDQNTEPSGIYMPSGVNRSALVMKPLVNVRSGPGEHYPVLREVYYGYRLTIIGEENNWLAVQLPDSSKGWIAAWLVAVRYDADKQDSIEKGNPTTNLVSRWSATEPENSGGLPTIADLLVEQSGSKVELEIRADSPLGLPSTMCLDNPSRLVFDFAAYLGESEVFPTLEVPKGVVHCFRLGQYDDQTVRVVADLQAPATYALKQSPDGKTINIQIQPLASGGRIVVIDPGHGTLNQWESSDPGAIGPSGVKERDVNLSISGLLGNILLNEGYTVIYTNENNTGLSLEERALVAGLSGADLLVSIHSNASTNRSLSGTMTFYYDAPEYEQGSTRIQKSIALAGFIQAELLNRLQREDKGVQKANFAVLRNCSIPAVLVEVAFISNPVEEKLLADPAFQRRAAEAIALGIKRYYNYSE